MIVYYGERNDGFEDLDLVLDAAESLQLAADLYRNGAIIKCETVGIDPNPFDRLLGRVIVRFTSGLVKIQVRNGRDLVFSGGAEALSVLAENLRNFGELPVDIRGAKGYHIHIEYYPDDFFLSPDAVPLVVTSKEGRIRS
jgi:hypothetical protein